MSFDPNSPQGRRVNLIVSLISRLKLVVRLMRDPRVPLITKSLPFASLLYVLLPLDFIPDVIPVLGQLDDLGVVMLAVEAFIRMAPRDIVQEHSAAIEREAAGVHTEVTVIDGEWRQVK